MPYRTAMGMRAKARNRVLFMRYSTIEKMITMIARIHGGWIYGAIKMKESIRTAARRSPRRFIIHFFVGPLGIRAFVSGWKCCPSQDHPDCCRISLMPAGTALFVFD
jgi:hypothetical protein